MYIKGFEMYIFEFKLPLKNLLLLLEFFNIFNSNNITSLFDDEEDTCLCVEKRKRKWK